jgi:hypothetical protein
MTKKKSPALPRIGFDRFIRATWIDCALATRTGAADAADLAKVLDDAGLGKAAQVKTMTVLKKLWLHPSSELHDLASRCAAIASDGSANTTPLHWCMAIASYPFFGKVAELFGKLSAIQGDCTSSELHRRMSEIYGEREGTYRMTNMVLQTHADWGTLRRTDKRLERCPNLSVTDHRVAALLAEAAVRYHAKSLPVSSLFSLPVLYPFKVSTRASQLASQSRALELRPNSRGEPLFAIRA